MCLAQGPLRSDAGEARTHGPSVSSQALYHLATALPARKDGIKSELDSKFHSLCEPAPPDSATSYSEII